ncbi:ornithine carbamoyltransferase [Methanolobus sp. WCC1]|jgi:ornithine carbamoyltransferase|uniref:Ornithine carbamoyltransferase n=1 Tax=Methanolobus tindarius DSM 2278 TaxID=1090322 RepID=W9DZA3_METTI|nr:MULTISPECIES: ornithine carbamoyltransferase [Methanolobus]ETA68706.1 ornithine carbamoyltransferase [Methanolobus tindarius DSM 2278]MDI3487219.1 ornithine carbamoyltransferase [Methanolobus sp.]MDK2827000.1 ornithine carbamoyltransferase [Methanolobus sp.]MDK2831668.1 ornithine carbamoyltransferase [Methanolobus sp.]
MKHLISMADLTHDEINELLDMAEDLKEKRLRGKVTDLLKNKSLGMIFEKSSTRTRVSFEVAMCDLGGHALYLNARDMQLGRGETVGDTSEVLSRYLYAIIARVYSHETVKQLAENSSIPVINALSDKEHPCQILADLLTIREYKSKIAGLKYAWVGDGNNVCNSAIIGGALMDMEVAVACPPGYEPDEDIVELARELGGNITITNDPSEAVKDADILYADVWVSMGDEEEREKRLKDLAPYQINTELVEQAKPDVIVMHCLPAHRGEEISAEVMDGPHSVVFDQAENRLHAQKALLMKMMA